MKATKHIFEKNFFFIFFATVCTALWGTAFPGVKLGYDLFNINADETGSKLLFAGVRFALAGIIVLAVYCIKTGAFPTFSKKEAPPILALSAVQIAGNYFFYYLGLSVTAGSIASVLNSFDTFCAVLLVPLFFKNDKLSPKKLIGCAIGLAGIILVNIGTDSNFSFSLNAEGFLLISALFSTAGIMINKKASMQSDPMIVTGYHLLFGGIILMLIAVFLEGKISFSNIKADICLLYLALVSAVAFLIWSQLLKHNPISKVSMFKLMTPIFGNIFSSIFLKENIFDPLHIVSVVLVAIGIATVNAEIKKRQSPKALP